MNDLKQAVLEYLAQKKYFDEQWEIWRQAELRWKEAGSKLGQLRADLTKWVNREFPRRSVKLPDGYILLDWRDTDPSNIAQAVTVTIFDADGRQL